MKNFKNSLLPFLLLSFFLPTDLVAQERLYRVPPVQLVSLKKMEENAYGLNVETPQSVINSKVWQNTSYPVVAGKFAEVPLVLSPVAQTLFLDLIRMSAPPPQGTTGDAFVNLKLNLLFQRGRFEDVYRLIQKIPESKRTSKIDKIYAEVLLLQDLQTACFLSKKTDGDEFWLKMTAVCDAFNLEKAKAELGLSVLKEQNETEAFIQAAVESFLSQKPLTVEPESITPLNVAVWRKAGKSLMDLKDKSHSLWFKRIFATDEEVNPKDRLNTAEELVEIGLLSPLYLRMLYQQVAFEEDVVPESLSGIDLRAYAVQSAGALSRSVQDNLKKQAFMKKGIESAKKDGVLYAFANGSKDVLETVKPDLETLANSADFIEAFALAGLKTLAIEWYKKAEILFPISQTTAYSWPFVALSEEHKENILFIPMIERSLAYFEKQEKAEDYTQSLDKAMLMFQMLDLISPDETWHYSSFEEGTAESFLVSQKRQPHSLFQEATGTQILGALQESEGDYLSLLMSAKTLSQLGLEQEAKELILQSLKRIFETKKDE